MGWGRAVGSGGTTEARGTAPVTGHQPCPPAGPQFPHPRPEAKERKLENTNLGQLQIRMQVI